MSHAVRLFSLSDDEDRVPFDRLLASDSVLYRHDTIDVQLGELLATRNPSRPRSEMAALVEDHLDGVPRATYGTWVYYPWSRRLVHVLPQDEFWEVRSDRNRYNITRL